ncbi:MAG: hypothetical protein EKK55_08745 [Rhodocyclaceae bacterium]|nr:MAG: hypothetical protein EKK55_08745 [Rhodocyclaceae bacterium]
MVDLLGRTPVVGDLYLLAGIVRAIESGTLVVVPGTGHLAVRVAEGQVVRLQDLAAVAYVDSSVATAVAFAAATFQPKDAVLDILSSFDALADTMPYFTGASTGARTAFTALARTLIAGATAADMRTTLGLAALAILGVGGGLESSGGNLQRSAITGDVSVAAGSNVATIQREVAWVQFDDMFWSTLPNGGWTAGSSGTGTTPVAATAGVDSTEKAQGVVQLTTGSTSTGRSSIYQGLNSLLLGQGTALEFETRLYVGNLSTASEEYVLHFGFLDNANASAEPTDSAAFVYRRATDGDFWVLQTRSASSETKTVTSDEPSASAYAIFKIVVAADGGSVEFFIDGVSKGTHTTNIPTGAGRQTGIGMRIYKTAGTTARVVNIDWVRIKASGSAR